METAKEHFNKTGNWLMDRGISPTEILEALKIIVGELEGLSPSK